MKLTVTSVNQPTVGAIDLTLRFSEIDPALAAKVTALGQLVQQAAADGKFTLTEDMMIGLALGAIFSK